MGDGKAPKALLQSPSAVDGLQVPAQSNRDCCLSYTKVRLPRGVLTGYTVQLSSEVCDIPAIIFHTYSGLKACVNPKEGWVKKHLHFLSQKLSFQQGTKHRHG